VLEYHERYLARYHYARAMRERQFHLINEHLLTHVLTGVDDSNISEQKLAEIINVSNCVDLRNQFHVCELEVTS